MLLPGWLPPPQPGPGWVAEAVSKAGRWLPLHSIRALSRQKATWRPAEKLIFPGAAKRGSSGARPGRALPRLEPRASPHPSAGCGLILIPSGRRACLPGRGCNQSQPALPRQQPARGRCCPAPGRAPEEHPGGASACGDITMPLSCRGMFPLFQSVATSPHCHDFSNRMGSTEPLPPQGAEDQRKHLLGCALSSVPRPQGNALPFSSSAPRRVQLVLAGLLDPTVQRDGSLLSPGPGDGPAAKNAQTGLPRTACARGPWINTTG